MDDGFDELFKRLFEALDFSDPKLQAKFRQGLQQGLDEAGFGRSVTVDVKLDGDEPPDVTVIDGGLDDDATLDGDADPPDLEVVDGDGGRPEVDVKVTRIPMPGRIGPSAPTTEGQIAVRGRQTLFRGSTPAPYRLFIDRGEAQVVLDGDAVETMIAGQTMDVDASMIQVRGDADGRYRRLIIPR